MPRRLRGAPTATAAPPVRIFISYRRDDSAGYAGRLEASLEQRLGAGCVFRDASDIAPGTDFAAVIARRLAAAQAVVVLIGPRWAGAGEAGRRRIDEAGDFVRIEVQAALAAGVRVVPALLPGASMPAAASLPVPLQPLAALQALALGDAHWESDVTRLATALGWRAGISGEQRRRWLLGTALASTGAAAGAWFWLAGRRAAEGGANADPGEAALLGSWQAELRYAWGDRYGERFVFERHAGELGGSASFLGHPRAIEALRFDGRNLHFQTRSRWSVSDGTQGEQTLAYAAELRREGAQPVLALRLQISGSYQSQPPLDFVARRVADDP